MKSCSSHMSCQIRCAWRSASNFATISAWNSRALLGGPGPTGGRGALSEPPNSPSHGRSVPAVRFGALSEVPNLVSHVRFVPAVGFGSVSESQGSPPNARSEPVVELTPAMPASDNRMYRFTVLRLIPRCSAIACFERPSLHRLRIACLISTLK